MSVLSLRAGPSWPSGRIASTELMPVARNFYGAESVPRYREPHDSPVAFDRLVTRRLVEADSLGVAQVESEGDDRLVCGAGRIEDSDDEARAVFGWLARCEHE